ncbi:Hypothetical protein NTJ_11443 [Nesidiocoris tenuis]|uniref:Uncharacterized protein n=1 Tax=Nesidiocoris tenuis TaxID=355587 RepID=A0ABN7B315_9HEMI|nr:Hypothetical protein NTJ_11443 [Nesidiocoris tenuis]
MQPGPIRAISVTYSEYSVMVDTKNKGKNHYEQEGADAQASTGRFLFPAHVNLGLSSTKNLVHPEAHLTKKSSKLIGKRLGSRRRRTMNSEFE